MRDGEGFQPGGTYESGALDVVIHNAIIMDPVLGVVKGDIGIRDGRIVGVGKAGNPDLMDGVSEGLATGPNTTVMHGDGQIVTPGGIEAHAHFLSPQQAWHALAGELHHHDRHVARPAFRCEFIGAEHPGALIRAADEFPLNFSFLGRGCMDFDASV